MMFQGRHEKLHRWVYAEMYGEIKDGLFVLHSCDNPLCVNPEHLRLGTNEDNMKDKMDRNRQPRGEANGRSKLTEEDVLEIRYIETQLSNKKLSKIYGVSDAVINDVRNFKTWIHV